MFFNLQLVVRDKPLIACVDQMVQYFLLGTSRNTRESGKLFVTKSSEALGNVGGSRSRSVTQLVDEPKVTLDASALEQFVDAKLYRHRTLPRNYLAKVLPSGHSERRSKREAAIEK